MEIKNNYMILTNWSVGLKKSRGYTILGNVSDYVKALETPALIMKKTVK